jgi:hypothetical protein
LIGIERTIIDEVETLRPAAAQGIMMRALETALFALVRINAGALSLPFPVFEEPRD